MQFQADVLGEEVIRPEITEVTALGAAYLAGLAVGYWKDLETIQTQWNVNKRFKPNQDYNRDHVIRQWNRAVDTAIHWAQQEKN